MEVIQVLRHVVALALIVTTFIPMMLYSLVYTQECTDRSPKKVFQFGGFRRERRCQEENHLTGCHLNHRRMNNSLARNIVVVGKPNSTIPKELVCFIRSGRPGYSIGYGHRRVVCKGIMDQGNVKNQGDQLMYFTDERMLRRTYYPGLYGESFSLTCSVSRYDSIAWKRPNGHTVTMKRVLTFDGLTFNDQGGYVCVASNGTTTITSEPQIVIIRDYLKYTVTLPVNTTLQTIFNERMVTSGIVVEDGRVEGNNTFVEYDLYKKMDDTNWINPSYVIAIRAAVVDIYRLDAANLVNSVSYCSKDTVETKYGVMKFQKDTFAGDIANSNEESWTERAAPRATRLCTGDFVSAAEWDDPIITNALDTVNNNISSQIGNFRHHLENETVTEDIAPYVAEVLENLTASANISQDLFDTLTLGLKRVSQANSTSTIVTESILDTVNNLVNIVDERSGNDSASPVTLSPSTSAIILRAFEEQMSNVRSAVGAQNTSFNYETPNVAVRVQRVVIHESVTFTAVLKRNGSDGKEEISHTRLEESPRREVDRSGGNAGTYREASIKIPKEVNEQASKEGVPILFVIHRNNVLFTEDTDTKNGSEPSLKLGTDIISASIETNVEGLPDESNIEIELPPLQVKECAQGVCAFWNNSRWETQGCQMVEKSPDVFTCRCNHLTNFAVLLDPAGDAGSEALDILSRIGCALSILSLTLNVITYLSSKKLRCSRPKQIIVNISLALLGLYITFLFGIERVDLGIACEICGALIHFFVLSSITWMSIEAVNLYLLIVKVFNADVKRFMLKASTIGWGIPAVVVGACLASSPTSYRTCWPTYYCFPDARSLVFKVGILGLVVFLLLFNLVIFILVTRKLTCARKNISKKVDGKRREILQQLRTTVILSITLGMTWFFGLLAIRNARMFFNILFCLFNSFQGLCIFIFFGVMQKDVRDIWVTWFRSCRRVPVSIFPRSTNLPSTVQDKSTQGKSAVSGKKTVQSSNKLASLTSESFDTYEEIPITNSYQRLNSADAPVVYSELKDEVLVSTADHSDVTRNMPAPRSAGTRVDNAASATVEFTKHETPRSAEGLVDPLDEVIYEDIPAQVDESEYHFIEFKPTAATKDASVRVTASYRAGSNASNTGGAVRRKQSSCVTI